MGRYKVRADSCQKAHRWRDLDSPVTDCLQCGRWRIYTGQTPAGKPAYRYNVSMPWRAEDRVRLLHMGDDEDAVPAGMTGTVLYPLLFGTDLVVKIAWDNGVVLGVVPGTDVIEEALARVLGGREGHGQQEPLPAAEG